MAKFKCSVCGYIYNESTEDLPFSSLDDSYVCPTCGAKKSVFQEIEETDSPAPPSSSNPLAYPEEFAKSESAEFPQMDVIHHMALTGKSIIDAMGTLKPVISWDDILIMGAQLNPSPLNEGDPVDTTTVIGKKAKKPMTINHPIYVSHMSFGALSKEMKTALAK